ncbi:MAG TPA: carbohydrate-binding family 9-like protein [Bacteroidales bacterium]|nr:carbohydrate-binding family 9-like protein [Bacteroidales bacterium]
MRIAEISKVDHNLIFNSQSLVETMFQQVRNAIDTVNWASHLYKPSVSFAAAYTEEEIIISFFVDEKWFKAEKTKPNENVFEDSCVEFFCSPANDGIYYNFEFNALGTCLMGTGQGRHDRKRTDPTIINEIITIPSIGNKPVTKKESRSWNLTILIPKHVFFLHKIDVFKGKCFPANLYKCGDKLETPHYLSWNPVNTPSPDFHRPECFGVFKFV